MTACSFLALSAIALSGPKADDLTTIEGTVAAVYKVISGPAGEKRDWDKMRSLFQPEARMIAVAKTPTGEVRKRAITVEDYIKQSGPILEERGFFEKEVAQKTEQYSNIAHVFSTYEARTKLSDDKPFMRGINSFQLWNDGKRWWVVTIYWQSEDPSTVIPDKYLKTGG